tara:strand:- start:242 stop:550 length:309 start_codon:yes stop_codon:yes gene_type:complete
LHQKLLSVLQNWGCLGRREIAITVEIGVYPDESNSKAKANVYLIFRKSLVCCVTSQINTIRLQTLSTCLTSKRNKPFSRRPNEDCHQLKITEKITSRVPDSD